MTTFLILSFLYLFLFPFLYLQILKRILKRIVHFRKIINSRYATYKIHNAMGEWFTDEKMLFEALSGSIYPVLVMNNYHRLYGKDLRVCLEEELGYVSFHKAYTLLTK